MSVSVLSKPLKVLLLFCLLLSVEIGAEAKLNPLNVKKMDWEKFGIINTEFKLRVYENEDPTSTMIIGALTIIRNPNNNTLHAE